MPAPPWDAFPYHRPGSAVTFPRDEGWHNLLPGGLANPSLGEMEWVYLNAHVKEVGGAGRDFIVFAAYFTQGLRFLVVRAWDGADGYLGGWTGTAWGRLRPSPERLDLRFDHGGGVDTWASRLDGMGKIIPFASRLDAIDDAKKFRLSLSIDNTKRPYEAGGRGYLPFGKNGSFYYYSLTRLSVGGTLTLPTSGGEETITVAGTGWYDHQWGPFYVTPFRNEHLEEYEWMSVQLDSGDELLLTTVWEPGGETPSLAAYGGAGLIRADGTFDKLIGAHRWHRTGFWRSPRQHTVYSSGWTFEAPEWGCSLTITPRHLDQLTPIVDDPPPGLLGSLSTLVSGWTGFLGDFWEGSCRVSGTFGGAPATGLAFAELIKRYEDPAFTVRVVRRQPDLCVLEWRVENPDEQVTLTSRFLLEDANGGVLLDVSGLDVPVMVLDDPALPKGVPLLARVVVSDATGVLSGTSTATVTLR